MGPHETPGDIPPMTPEGSVSRWIDALRAGDRAAAQHLWNRYFRELVVLASAKLRAAPRRAADEEDVALSAFDTFCRRAAQGRFPDLVDRDGLWRLLMVITARKAAHLIRDAGRQKRGGSESAAADSEDGLLDQVLSREPNPEFAAEVADECQRLLRKLTDPGLESIALWRMEGYTVDEIAGRLGRLDMDGDEQKLVQELARLIQRGQPAVVELPDGVGDFDESQIENDQPFAFQRHFGDKPLRLVRVRLCDNPLGDDAAIDDDVAHRLRSSAMSRVLSGKAPRSAMMRFCISCTPASQARTSAASSG
jgi:DNA-directed RNA polymerase specialized sigma24 family protein